MRLFLITIISMKRIVHHIPYKGYYTFCYTFGDVKSGIPLIILHGGPGGCDERYEPLEQLADQGIPLIFYDQLGCGYSKVPKGNSHLWDFKLYLDELENVIKYFGLKEFYILGHSWGGMLALEWVTTRKHDGLKKMVLFSTLPSTKIWNDEHIKMLDSFPENERVALLNEFNNKEYNKKDYKAGIKRFYAEHVAKKKDKKYVFKRKKFPKTNREIYGKMWGKSELFGTGTLLEWNTIPNLKNIEIPTLILSGKFDESTLEMNRVMNKEIKNSKWVVLEKSHHIGYAEEPDIALDEISKFIK